MKRFTDFIHLTAGNRLDIASLLAIAGLIMSQHSKLYLIALLPKTIDIVHSILTRQRDTELLKKAEQAIERQIETEKQLGVLTASVTRLHNELSGLYGKVMGTNF